MSEEKNKGGRPLTLTPEIGAQLIAHVRRQISIAGAARLSMLPQSTVMSWVTRGLAEALAGEDTEQSRFALSLKKAHWERVEEHVREIANHVQNWQSSAWILERMCAEDFGKDSELYKQLLEDYKMLMQSLIDNNKGANHGGKVDSKSED